MASYTRSRIGLAAGSLIYQSLCAPTAPAAGGVRGVSPRQPPRLPASAEEHLLGAGHSVSEPGLTDAIVRATDPVWDAKTGDGEAWA